MSRETSLSRYGSRLSEVQPLSLGVKFGTAGMGGVFGWWVVHPFNTAAVRMNLAHMSGAKNMPKGTFGFISQLVKNEGVGTLYKGFWAATLRQVCYATSRLGLFEVFRDLISSQNGGKVDFSTRIAAGSISGAAAAYISCPAEVTTVRMANDAALPPGERRNYKNVGDAFVRIVREEGAGAFFRGSRPYVARCVAVGMCQVATYDQFKDSYQQYFGLTGLQNHVASALSAGLFYSLLTMPLETSKNRMAFQKPDPKTGELQYRGVAQTIQRIAAKEGALKLWYGFLPYYGRCGGHTVSMFVFVEQIRALYRARVYGFAEEEQ